MYSELRPIQTFEVDIWGRVVVIMVEAVLVFIRRRLIGAVDAMILAVDMIEVVDAVNLADMVYAK